MLEAMNMQNEIIYGPTLAGEGDVYLFREGTHRRIYDFLGAHPFEYEGRKGVLFSIWAPGAKNVYVMGDFNSWEREGCPLAPRWDSSGIWEGFVPNAEAGCRYKYVIRTAGGELVDKSDPLAFAAETPPASASVVCAPTHEWRDAEWMAARAEKNATDAPQSIYEMHVGSWQRGDGDSILSWRDLAGELPPYLEANGFTHV